MLIPFHPIIFIYSTNYSTAKSFVNIGQLATTASANSIFAIRAEKVVQKQGKWMVSRTAPEFIKNMKNFIHIFLH